MLEIQNENNGERITEDRKMRRLWIIVVTMLIIGILTIISNAAGVATEFKFFLNSASTGLLISGAFFSAGSLAGFLFAIPKLIQNQSVVSNSENNRPIIVHNDNLVQISDWLTKIIVGVGLTQLYNIPSFIIKIGDKFKDSFGFNEAGRNAAIGAVLYFLIIGFLCVYIWTRLYFVKLLKDLDDVLNPISELTKIVNQNAKEQDKRLKFSILNTKIEQFEKLRNMIINSENNFDGLKDFFKNFTPGPIKIIDDCQRDRWGGKMSSNGIIVSAEIHESPDLSVENKKIFNVSINVAGENQPLTGKVFFFLHESYVPNQILIKEAVNNSAIIQFESYEAFTVGVLCNDGATALELDLNALPNIPEEYKYSEILQSIDHLYEERNDLAETKETL